MTGARFTVLVAFDTPSAVRRRQFTRRLARYGVRVQRSVFEVSVTARELDALWTSLARVADSEQDALLVGRMLPGGVRRLGSGAGVTEWPLLAM